MKKRVVIGADHAGFALKEKIKKYLEKHGYKYEDLSSPVLKPNDDYPDIAKDVATRVVEKNTFGILVCGTGSGMSIAANKIRGIRAATIYNEKEAYLARSHNDANVLCLNGLELGNIEKLKRNKNKDLLKMKFKPSSFTKAQKIIDTFFKTKFSAGRHKRRIEKIKKIES